MPLNLCISSSIEAESPRTRITSLCCYSCCVLQEQIPWMHSTLERDCSWSHCTLTSGEEHVAPLERIFLKRLQML